MSRWGQMSQLLRRACREAFGVPVTYLPSHKTRPELAGASFETTAILDERRQVTTLGGEPGLEVASTVTTLDLRLADLPVVPREGDEVMVGNVTYRIQEALPDGQGSALLILTRNSDPFPR